MATKATFYAVEWIDRNGALHHGRIMGKSNEIRQALKDTGMSLVTLVRITDPTEIRELSLKTLSQAMVGDGSIVQRTVRRRRAVHDAMVKARRPIRQWRKRVRA